MSLKFSPTQRSKATLDRYSQILNEFFQFILYKHQFPTASLNEIRFINTDKLEINELLMLTSKEYKEYLDYCLKFKDNKIKTTKIKHIVVRDFLQWLESYGGQSLPLLSQIKLIRFSKVEKNPFPGNVLLNKSEAKYIVDYWDKSADSNKSKKYFLNRRNKALCLLMLECGLSAQALFNMSLQDLCLENRYLLLPNKKSIKMSDRLFETLGEYLDLKLKEVPLINNLLFVSFTGKKLNNDAFLKSLKKCGDELNIKLSPKLLQFSGISFIMDSTNINKYQLKEVLGVNVGINSKEYFDDNLITFVNN